MRTCLRTYFVLLLVLVGISILAFSYIIRPAHRTEVWHNHLTVAILDFSHFNNFILDCRLVMIETSDPEYKVKVLDELTHNYQLVREVNFDRMMNVIKTCEDLQPVPDAHKRDIKNEQEEDLDVAAIMRGIVPGTLWCGYDDIARDYKDLGQDYRLDKCCRAHDHCPVKVKAFSEGFGALNYHPYTKSHCTCDDAFYHCLKEVNSKTADAIGKIFFNSLNLQCVKDVPQRVCARPAHPNEVGVRTRSKRTSWFTVLRHIFGYRRQPEKKCLKWEENPNGPHRFIFKNPERSF